MKGTLLLVEDDDDARESLTRSLERAEFRVLPADGYESALTWLKTEKFLDIVVTDVVLGRNETGGLDVLRALHERDIGAPVVFITAFAELNNVKQALNEGAAYLLEKPFRAAELIAVLETVLAGPPSHMGYVVDRALLAAKLTDKEQIVARLLLKGLTSAEIARIENNSDKTVRQHITKIYAKFGVNTRAELFHHVFPW